MESKKWYASKTLWGVILSAVGKVVGAIFGFEMTETGVAELTDMVVALVSFGVSFVGDALAWYGRVKADKKIGKK